VTSPDDQLYERLLVLRAQLGEREALVALVDRYTPRLRYFLARLAGDAGAVDDLVQEVWLAALRGLPRLVAAAAFRTWLYRIARDQALGLLRRRRRLPQALENDHLLEDDAPDNFSAEDAAAIHRALDSLPAEQREAIVLRFIEDMTYDEIAAVTGAPVGTVRSRLHYAKRALRSQIGDPSP
jgi:RNA polymerase sigma-70 factor (ECF subfamily)